GSQGYVQPVQAFHDQQNGQIHLQETVPDLAAKTALAAQNQFSVKSSAFKAEDLLKHQEAEQEIGLKGAQLNIEAKKLGIDADKAAAYINRMNALADKDKGQNAQIKTDVTNKWGQIMNGVQFGATTKTGSSGFFGIGKTAPTKEDITDVSSLPEDFQYLSGPVIDPKTHKVTVKRLMPFTTEDGKSYYKNKYVDPKNGSSVDVYSKEWKDGYSDWKSKGYTGSYEDYLKKNLDNGAFQVVLQ